MAVEIRGPMKLLDAQSGTVLREYAWPWYGEYLIVDDLWVAVGGNDAEVYGASLTDGKTRWRHSLKSRPGTPSMVSAIFSASPTAAFFGRQDGRIHALSLESGEQVWQSSVAHLESDLPTGRTSGFPMGFTYVLGDLLILRLWGHWVAALSTSDGSIVWSHNTRHTILDGQLYGDRFYMTLFGAGYVVLDARTGEKLLEADLDATVPEKHRSRGPMWRNFPILVSETHLFTGLGSGGIAAIERDTGKCEWLHRMKGASSFQGQTYFMSVNGRLFFADLGNRLYCYEETKAAGKAAGQREPLEQEEGLPFRIEAIETRVSSTGRVAPGEGPETGTHEEARLLRCVAGEARFSMLVSLAASERALSVGEGALWVSSPEQGERLGEVVRKLWGGARTRTARPAEPTAFAVARLGEGVGEFGGSSGAWTHTKWTAPPGSPEFYVRWSEAERRGVITEKDEEYRKDLVRVLSRLAVR